MVISMKEQTSKNKVFINEYGTIEIIVHGDQTTESVTQMSDEADKLVNKLRKSGKPALILDNLMLIGKVPPEARKIVVERAKKIASDKIAFVGSDTIIRLGANLILQAIGKGSKVKYFDNYGEAINWLTEEK